MDKGIHSSRMTIYKLDPFREPNVRFKGPDQEFHLNHHAVCMCIFEFQNSIYAIFRRMKSLVT